MWNDNVGAGGGGEVLTQWRTAPCLLHVSIITIILMTLESFRAWNDATGLFTCKFLCFNNAIYTDI